MKMAWYCFLLALNTFLFDWVQETAITHTQERLSILSKCKSFALFVGSIVWPPPSTITIIRILFGEMMQNENLKKALSLVFMLNISLVRHCSD